MIDRPRSDGFHVPYHSVDAQAGDEVVYARWARLPYPILILGETGTGKSILARHLHDLSLPRGSCKTCSLAELTDEMAQSRLFGHIKGAFTGAYRDQEGVFEAASKGTVILEEIGKSSLAVQCDVLRVVEEKTVTRVGEQMERPVDFRLIAVSNLDLRAMVRDGKFLDDLFARFEYYILQLRPLRERRHLIVPLMLHHLLLESRTIGRCPPSLTAPAHALLLGAPWLHNLREIRNVARYLVGNAGREAGVADLPPAFLETLGMNPADLDEPIGARARRILEETGGNKSATARRLRMSRGKLYRILDEPVS